METMLIQILEIGCNCGCSKTIPREGFAELREAFQALSNLNKIYFNISTKTINGEITASRRLKKKTRTNKRTFYY